MPSNRSTVDLCSSSLLKIHFVFTWKTIKTQILRPMVSALFFKLFEVIGKLISVFTLFCVLGLSDRVPIGYHFGIHHLRSVMCVA